MQNSQRRNFPGTKCPPPPPPPLYDPVWLTYGSNPVGPQQQPQITQAQCWRRDHSCPFHHHRFHAPLPLFLGTNTAHPFRSLQFTIAPIEHITGTRHPHLLTHVTVHTGPRQDAYASGQCPSNLVGSVRRPSMLFMRVVPRLTQPRVQLWGFSTPRVIMTLPSKSSHTQPLPTLSYYRASLTTPHDSTAQSRRIPPIPIVDDRSHHTHLRHPLQYPKDTINLPLTPVLTAQTRNTPHPLNSLLTATASPTTTCTDPHLASYEPNPPA